MRISNIPIIGKVLIVLAAFGTMTTASVIFSTTKMHQINDGYSDAITRHGRAAQFLTEANRSFSGIKTAMTDLQISNTDAGNQDAMAHLKAQRQAFVDFMDKAARADPSKAAAIDSLVKRGLTIVDVTCQKALAMGAAATKPPDLIAAQAEHLVSCAPGFPAVLQALSQITTTALASQDGISVAMTGVTDSTVLITYIVTIGGIVSAMIGGFLAIGAWVSRPIKRLAVSMEHLAQGDLTVAVAGADRGDEIGPMARALEVFKDKGIRLEHSEAEAARQRKLAEQERVTNEAARVEIQRQQETVVASIAAGLALLAKGDLTGRLGDAFTQEYEKLRADFNATADSLQDALRTIVDATGGINSGSAEIAQASDDLSRRTELQAASLEETAAALDHITETVKKMAHGAAEAADVVAATRREALTSGGIVDEAIDAMGAIKDSSYKVSQIIGVIDEIAFQTNLLALNAGVEAARAGEAGRGFAVVASEVRALAQRSASSAKEIKTLIAASADQVENGVQLVGKTGTALKGIIEKIASVDLLVRDISASSKEQAIGLAEVNVAVGQMDHIVQQNAAMVEESTAAAHSLRNDTQNLRSMIGRFTIDQDPAVHANPVHKVQAKIAASMRRV